MLAQLQAAPTEPIRICLTDHCSLTLPWRIGKMIWSDYLIDLLNDFVHIPARFAEFDWVLTLIVLGAGATVIAAAAPALALVLIWITRKVIGRIQDRLGPNRLGPGGIFQTVADAVKLMSKEDIRPANADWISYNLAPILSVFGVIMTVGVIVFAPGIVGVDLNIAVLYIIALSSIGILAALMAGWSSNNKYALLAGFRVVAQLMSYEIPMVLAAFTVVLLAGSMRMTTIAEAQALEIFGLNLGIGWFGFLMPAAFLIFGICALAESEQTPFDLLEAESELIAGFHIEYSGMKFAMFFLAQFLNTFFLGAIAVVLFMGGYQGPLVGNFHEWFGAAGMVIDILLGFFYFSVKAFLLYTGVMWIKGTLPRLRIDQMMGFCWKVLVPAVLALVLFQMIALKILPGVPIVGYALVFISNVGVIVYLGNFLQNYFEARKRAQ